MVMACSLADIEARRVDVIVVYNRLTIVMACDVLAETKIVCPRISLEFPPEFPQSERDQTQTGIHRRGSRSNRDA